MSPNLLFLDSGAFSVWNSGGVVDIDRYIEFCLNHPGVSYYANLDAIPGKPGDASAPRVEAMIDAACEESFNNYKKMVARLPIEKVIAVYHRGEDIKWLQRYLDFGAQYIGIGQAVAFGGKKDQKEWLKTLWPLLLNSDRTLKVKTHGFAITSFDLMNFMPWHSVDSTSWLKQAAYGVVYVPYRKGGEDDYSRAPFLLNCSPKSPSRHDPFHITTLSPSIKEMVDDYFGRMKIRPGLHKVIDVPLGYKKTEDELWFDKTKKQIIRIEQRGVVTCHQHRFRANAKYIQAANKVLDVEHIYFAGGEGSVDDHIEYNLRRRLMSYHKIGMVKDETLGKKAFLRWEQMAAEAAAAA
jgi:hypothetical protein